MSDLEANFERAKLIWDEYKYRHELCWKLLFQLTFAVVVVSLVPYTPPSEMIELKWATILLPITGLGLTILSIRRMETEIKLWKKIKAKHDTIRITLDMAEKQTEDSRDFGKDIMFVLWALFALGIVNIIILVLLWTCSS